MQPNITNTAATWVKNASLAVLSQFCFSIRSIILEALKKETVAIRAAIKESKTKKCPICPGNKCSPSNFMYAILYPQLVSS